RVGSGRWTRAGEPAGDIYGGCGSGTRVQRRRDFNPHGRGYSHTAHGRERILDRSLWRRMGRVAATFIPELTTLSERLRTLHNHIEIKQTKPRITVDTAQNEGMTMRLTKLQSTLVIRTTGTFATLF